MILICTGGHEWDDTQVEGVEFGQTCGALLYGHWDYPERTVRCQNKLVKRIIDGTRPDMLSFTTGSRS